MSLQKAKQSLKRARADQIVVGLDQLTSVDPKHWGGYCLWREIDCDPRRLGGALAHLDRALRQNSRDAVARALRGRTLRLLGDLKEARKDLNEAVRLSPDNAYARACLAELMRAAADSGWRQAFERSLRSDKRCVWAYLWRASWALSEGELSPAAEDLKAADGLKQPTVLGHVLAGMLAIQLRDYKEAVRRLGQAAGLDPDCPGIWVLRGQTQWWAGNAEAAEADFERAVRRDHDCKVAYYSMLGCGDLPDNAEGLKTLDRAVRKFPKSAWVYALRGELRRMPGLAQYEEAIEDLRHAVRLKPRQAWLHAFLGRAYGNTGRGKQGLASITRAIELDPKCAWMYAWRGEALRKAGRRAGALKDFSRSIRLDPRYVYAFAWRGSLYRYMGKHRQALSDLDRAVDLHPRYDLSYYHRAVSRLALGDGPGAMNDMATAARMNPKYGWWSGPLAGRENEKRSVMKLLNAAARKDRKGAWTLAWRGETRIKFSDFKGALEDLSAAIGRDGQLAWAYAWRGEALVGLGRHKEGIADLERATRLDPHYARGWAWLGRARHLSGQYRKALESFDSSVRLDAKSAWVFGWRGETRLIMEDYLGAVRELDRALTLDRRFIAAYRWRGEALRRLGRPEKALCDLDRCLELEPQQPLVWVSRALARQALGDIRGQMLDFARAAALDSNLMERAARNSLREQLAANAAAKDAECARALIRMEPEWAPGFLLLSEALRGEDAGESLSMLDRAWNLNEYGTWCFLAGQYQNWPDLISRCDNGPGALGGRKLLGSDTYERMKSSIDRRIAGVKTGVPGWLYQWRGEAMFKTGNLKEAIADLTRAISKAPQPKALAWRGEARFWSGDPRGALADFNRAVKLSPREHWLYGWRGQLKLWMGRYRQARQDFEKALSLDSKHPWAYGWRGASRMMLGDRHGALRDLSHALRSDPRDVEARVWRGELYRKTGRPKQALEDLNRVLILKPDQFWALLNRYLVNISLGRKGHARRDWDCAARLAGEKFPSSVVESAAPRAAKKLLEQARGNRCIGRIV